MADPQQNTDKNPPSRARKLAGMVGEALVVRSPILSQLRETAESVTEKPEQGKSRLGNVLGSIQQAAVNRSPIIRNFLMMKDALMSVLKKDKPQQGDQKYGKATEQKSETQKDQKTSQGTDNTVAIVEYLKNLENPYYVVMKSDNNYLKDIVDVLKQQSQIMRDTLQMNKENQERSTTQKALESVSRSDASRARAAQQPRDERGRFIKQEDVVPSTGGLADTIDAIDDAFDIVKSLKKYGGVIASGFAAATTTFARYKNAIVSKISFLGSGLKGVAARMRPMAAGFTSKIGAMVGKVGSKAAPWLSKALPVVGRALGPAAALYGGVSSMNNLTDRVNQVAEERGITQQEALTIVQEENRKGMEDFFRSTPGFNQIMDLGDWTQSLGEDMRKWWNDEEPQSKPRPTTEMYYGDSNPLINRMIRDYTTDKDGFALSPDVIRSKLGDERRAVEISPPVAAPPTYAAPPPILSIEPSSANGIEDYLKSIQPPSPAAVEGLTVAKMREYLNSMGNTTAKPIQAAQPPSAAPVIVNNQGGPTSINNGGNVTNIITGGSSLALPQLAYNLSSSLS